MGQLAGHDQLRSVGREGDESRSGSPGRHRPGGAEGSAVVDVEARDRVITTVGHQQHSRIRSEHDAGRGVVSRCRHAARREARERLQVRPVDPVHRHCRGQLLGQVEQRPPRVHHGVTWAAARRGAQLADYPHARLGQRDREDTVQALVGHPHDLTLGVDQDLVRMRAALLGPVWSGMAGQTQQRGRRGREPVVVQRQVGDHARRVVGDQQQIGSRQRQVHGIATARRDGREVLGVP
nr:hypothetical protein [Arsenicicoccus piscis]